MFFASTVGSGDCLDEFEKMLFENAGSRKGSFSFGLSHSLFRIFVFPLHDLLRANLLGIRRNVSVSINFTFSLFA